MTHVRFLYEKFVVSRCFCKQSKIRRKTAPRLFGNMEIVNPCFSVLANMEVLEALKNIKDTKKKYGLRNLATIAYETLQYLEDSPCKTQTGQAILEFLKEVKPYKLTNNECLMMINDPPQTALHIQLLVEDSEERLSEDQVNSVLEIVKKNLPQIADSSNQQ